MEKAIWLAIVTAALHVIVSAHAQPSSTPVASDECRSCLQNELAGLGQNATAMAALGAIGGLAAASLPGAVCGAVLGAAGVGVTALINVANKCVPICKKGRAPASVGQCDDFLVKARGS